MSNRFTDKVVLITGASSGIGAETAHAFAREGAHVFLVARRSGKGEAVAAAIRTAGGSATFHQADMADQSSIESMVEACVETYGKLDIAFNNAGVEGVAFTPTAEYDIKTWNEVISINLTGVWLCMKYQIPHILKAGGGSIINTASVAGLKGFAGSSGYAASKFGVIGITRAAALEYAAQGIRINAVCPAVIKSEMTDRMFFGDPEVEEFVTSLHPIGRTGTPDEIAGPVLWLASEDASFVLGCALPIDGGLMA